ncbi:MAG: ankyrin repeat domain-containing protein [Lentisphaeria bacterium]|nr:ankyrin repeat domain-containing protein [Lentisphaeria bacterium]
MKYIIILIVFIAFGVSDADDNYSWITPEKIDLTTIKDFNKQDLQGNSPLHHAVVNGNHELIKALVEKGANTKVRNKIGLSPLFIASVIKRDSVSLSLLMKVANDETSALPFRPVEFGSAPLPPNFPTQITKVSQSIVQNPTFGYNLRISPEWTYSEYRQDNMWYKISILSYILPPVKRLKNNGTATHEITVKCTLQSPNMSLKDYAAQFKKSLPIKTKDILSEEDKHILDGEFSLHNTIFKRRVMILKKNKIFYELMFTATEDSFEKNKNVFMNFAEQIKFYEAK